MTPSAAVEEVRARHVAAEWSLKKTGGYLGNEESAWAHADRATLLRAYEEVVKERDQQIVQLAGCSVAALGWAHGENACAPDAYGWSVPYADIVKLRERMEQAEARVAALEAAALTITTDAAQDALEDPIGNHWREKAGWVRISKEANRQLNAVIVAGNRL